MSSTFPGVHLKASGIIIPKLWASNPQKWCVSTRKVIFRRPCKTQVYSFWVILIWRSALTRTHTHIYIYMNIIPYIYNYIYMWYNHQINRLGVCWFQRSPRAQVRQSSGQEPRGNSWATMGVDQTYALNMYHAGQTCMIYHDTHDIYTDIWWNMMKYDEICTAYTFAFAYA